MYVLALSGQFEGELTMSDVPAGVAWSQPPGVRGPDPGAGRTERLWQEHGHATTAAFLRTIVGTGRSVDTI